MEINRPYTPFSLWHYSNPLMLLAGILVYALGVGVAHYLGYVIHWKDYLIGQGCVTFLQLSGYLLGLYFDLPKRSMNSKGEVGEAEDNQPLPIAITRTRLLPFIYSLLTVGAMFTALLFTNGHFNLLTIVILGIGFFLAFFYAVPPIKFVYSGYGELEQAILVTNIIPAFAFIIQTGQLHRLLAMITFPLTLLYLAMALALSLPTYAGDLKHNRKTLMIRLGWQHGMSLHNLLILSAYTILLLAAVLGLPWALTWPGLLTIPIAIFQIIQLYQIASGTKPRWKLLEYTAISSFMFSAYFLTLALWTR